MNIISNLTPKEQQEFIGVLKYVDAYCPTKKGTREKLTKNLLLNPQYSEYITKKFVPKQYSVLVAMEIPLNLIPLYLNNCNKIAEELFKFRLRINK